MNKLVNKEEKLTAEDYMYLRVAVGQFLANPENKEMMPKSIIGISKLEEKLNHNWKVLANQ